MERTWRRAAWPPFIARQMALSTTAFCFGVSGAVYSRRMPAASQNATKAALVNSPALSMRKHPRGPLPFRSARKRRVRLSTPRRPASTARKRRVPTAGSSKSSRDDPSDGRSSDRSSSTVTKSSKDRNGVKAPFDMAKHVFHLLFLEVDLDRSGCIDNKEFGEMLLQLGKNIGPDVARRCVVSNDIDRSDTIEADEFVDFMTHEFLAPALPSPGVLCETSVNRAWTIPR
ncbi:unnamed protein product [Ectocarpus sp. CCAP 1310/34]|nr:unnamed protein product [Ectocarpus sp. CCAP 1310/34]